MQYRSGDHKAAATETLKLATNSRQPL